MASDDGNFYGTTTNALFRFNPRTDTLTVLHQFTTSEGTPQGPPVEDKNRNLYGLSGIPGENGTAYRLTVLTGTFELISKTVPGFPSGPLLLASDGYFYGATLNGGASEAGAVFRMTAAGTIKTIYSFLNESDGAIPNAPLVQATRDGRLYGTAQIGGYNGTGAYGTVFQITLPNYQFATAYNFDGPAGGYKPTAGLLVDGDLYGTTSLGGLNNMGTIFQFGGGAFYKLFDFTGDGGLWSGAFPNTALMVDTNAACYGLTSAGGANGGGVLYRLNFADAVSHVAFCCSQWVVLDQPVTILGQNLTEAVNVTFGSVPAQFQQGSNTYLTAYVPSMAVDAPVIVTLSTGQQLDTNLPALILPRIASLDPSNGLEGTVVNIVGGGFTGTTEVTFDGIKATNYTVVTPALIQATVPVGAKTGYIGALTPNGFTRSTETFTVN